MRNQNQTERGEKTSRDGGLSPIPIIHIITCKQPTLSKDKTVRLGLKRNKPQVCTPYNSYESKDIGKRHSPKQRARGSHLISDKEESRKNGHKEEDHLHNDKETSSPNTDISKLLNCFQVHTANALATLPTSDGPSGCLDSGSLPLAYCTFSYMNIPVVEFNL